MSGRCLELGEHTLNNRVVTPKDACHALFYSIDM